ncbi:putative lignostilbene dioxygenase [Podospora aff. communis PSN243]|uniref:Lignostilbene dioxygenase n=1 Tax=Podospora aff. communis PSN243 TaxID=3040156 RepID=A0AAV9G1X9_9PEZI|nr:putative lignostilbene dioxygenase [Podospora aff. communis PSN243]
MSSPLPPVTSHFPPNPQFQGFMKPSGLEADAHNLEVIGTIPPSVSGTFYRVMPDPQFPPFIQNDPWFNGDGNISAFRIHPDGRVSFKQRYVRTEKFTREREAQRALLGKYRNKYTDAVEFAIRTTANTNVVHFNGKLLALKEDAPPYALDPDTLETIGLYDFDGQLPSLTFTAHPKFDPKTGEMLCFGYEAKGDGTPDVCYYRISAEGKLLETVWLVAPVVAMIHDFAVTENWVVFPIIPQVCDLDRLKAGGEHWQWSPETPFYIGVLPRRGGSAADVKWFRHPNSFPGHVANAYEDPSTGNLVVDLGLSASNVFFWWPDAQGNAPRPETIHSQLTRFTINPKSEDLEVTPDMVTALETTNSEFYRIDDRFAFQQHRHVFFDAMDPALGTDFGAIAPKLGGGYPLYNSLAHFDAQTGKTEVYFPGRTHMVQEPVFIPKKGSEVEGDGYLLALVNNYDTMGSELHLLDTTEGKFGECLAKVVLPVRLRHGLHGNWVDANNVKETK